MGMIIDEAIIQLSMQKFYALGKDYEAVQVAIDTMRKYQKIEQIIKDCEECELVENHALDEIREVIENGNGD